MSSLPRSPASTGCWFTPVDAASLAMFRIGFGLVMAWWAIDDLRLGRVRDLYVTPRFHFSYSGWEWVQPWPGAGPYWHYVVMLMLSILIAAGFWYRVCMPLFALCFAIFFLWDRTNYQNHYVLILFLSGTMAFLPLNRAFSLDAIQSEPRPSPWVPVWTVSLLRFHIALPYVYGGLAKLNRDWLGGAAMREFLAVNPLTTMKNSWFTTTEAALFLAWSGLVFDLVIVPLLLWKRTRWFAFVAVVMFHVTNHFLFQIHIFPWFMILVTTIFFEPDWPRRFVRFSPIAIPKPESLAPTSWKQRCGLSVMVVYMICQLLLPLRHFLYGGDVGWHEQGHYFAWRMMLRSKEAVVRYYVTDTVTGQTSNPLLRRMLSFHQLTTFGRDPEIVLSLAHALAEEYRLGTGHAAEVRALVLATYNGRKPQLLLDPTVDLAQQPRGWYHRDWIMPQQEPLPDQPWRRPVEDWEAAVKRPPLPVVTLQPQERQKRLRGTARVKSL